MYIYICYRFHSQPPTWMEYHSTIEKCNIVLMVSLRLIDDEPKQFVTLRQH
jgi:hypothetical protein